jgi:hypothetical protein
MTVLSIVYLVSLPMSWRAYHRRLASDRVSAKEAAEDDDEAGSPSEPDEPSEPDRPSEPDAPR